MVRDNQGTWWAYSLAGVWLGAGSGPGRTVSVLRERPADDGSCRTGDPAGACARPVPRRRLRGRARCRREGLGRAPGGVRYDAGGRLTRVATELGTRTYRWNEQGLIEAVVSAAGVLEAENTYDEHGRVVLQTSQHGRRTRFAYLPGPGHGGLG